MKMIDGEKLLARLEQRIVRLNDMTERDIGGGTMSHVQCLREAKYWKACIERGEFDSEYESRLASPDLHE